MQILEAGALQRDEAIDAATKAGHDGLVVKLREWSPITETVGAHIWDREWALCKAAKAGKLGEVKALIDADVDPNAGTQPEFPMATAAQQGNVEMMTLLHQEFSLLQRPSMTPPLSSAILSGKVEAIALLIEWGCEIDAGDHSNATPLHYAAIQGRDDIVAMLLEAGASPNTSDRFGNTPMSDAVKRGGNFEVVRRLAKHGATLKPGLFSFFVKYVTDESLPMLHALLEIGADLSERVDDVSIGDLAQQRLEAGHEAIFEALKGVGRPSPKRAPDEPWPDAVVDIGVDPKDLAEVARYSDEDFD